jgi:hypothetical protein
MSAFDKSHQHDKQKLFKRQEALERFAFRLPSVPREPPAGVTSFPLKAEDPETRRLIDAAIAARRDRT